MTKILTPDYWSERYNAQETGWDLGAISPPIKAYVDQLVDRSIRVLIPGCGFGYEGIYMVERGFKNVHFLDFSEVPLNFVRRMLPTLGAEQLHVQDFFQHKGTYDLIIEQTLFCAIDPELREKYTEKVHELLSTDGSLVGVLFNRFFDDGPPFGGTIQEYRELFGTFFTQVQLEPCYNSASPRKGTEVFINVKN